MMRKPLFFMLLMCIFAAGALVRAQETPAPVEPDSSLDVVVGTPMPLPTMGIRPAPSLTISGQRSTLSLYFRTLPQGTVGLVEVSGSDVNAASAAWLGSLLDFYAAADSHYALLSAGMEQQPRSGYPLAVSVSYRDGTRETLNAEIEIVLGSFIRREVVIPPDKGYLLDVETERAELARLESLFAASTPQQAWDSSGFGMPIPAALTSPFGEFRVFNSTLNTRHTGWDIRATTGTPVFASANGQVVFAGSLPIRGNHVIIDHGLGVYSGYSHLSVIYVTRGQAVTKGQVVGMTGTTGRTSGPHFHWEMAVNGEWIDSVQFLQMWLPG